MPKNEAGKYKFYFNTWFTPENEMPYPDEQMYWMRKPVEIPLRKGENVMHIIEPMIYDWQRWVFVFIPIEMRSDGRFCEAKGIRFAW